MTFDRLHPRTGKNYKRNSKTTVSALQYAVLANSSLEGIEFKDAKMNGADLEGADFTGVDVTTVINLNLAKNYDKAKGLDKPESEPETVTE